LTYLEKINFFYLISSNFLKKNEEKCLLQHTLGFWANITLDPLAHRLSLNSPLNHIAQSRLENFDMNSAESWMKFFLTAASHSVLCGIAQSRFGLRKQQSNKKIQWMNEMKKFWLA
jgi:hypothetical protein